MTYLVDVVPLVLLTALAVGGVCYGEVRAAAAELDRWRRASRPTPVCLDSRGGDSVTAPAGRRLRPPPGPGGARLLPGPGHHLEPVRSPMMVRSPRNTTAAMRDGVGDALALMAEAWNGGPGAAIESQEHQGQAQLVHSDVIPTRMYGCTDDDLVAAGFVLGPPVVDDPLFRQAELPPGWTRRAGDHPLASYLVDNQGRDRFLMQYKAAFYDRYATLTPLSADDHETGD